MKKELNTRSLFISTIFLACLAAVFITLIVLMVFYSCNICTYPYTPHPNKCPPCSTNYVSPTAAIAPTITVPTINYGLP